MSVNSFPGFIINSTTIAVDYWPKQDQPNLTHFFLTHCHTDHTKNLDASWTGPLIYCSKVFQIFQQKLIAEFMKMVFQFPKKKKKDF